MDGAVEVFPVTGAAGVAGRMRVQARETETRRRNEMELITLLIILLVGWFFGLFDFLGL